ncbi:PepSY-associated TM helix domain-containing protein [Acetobacter pasteurianus]
MKIRTDIVQMYRDIHSWVGILAGLFLFVAFYAGGISVFEVPLQNWLTKPAALPAPVSVQQVPDLMQKAFAAHPEAQQEYTVVLSPTVSLPARLMWPVQAGQRHAGPVDMIAASLDAEGHLVTVKHKPSEVAHFIDELHENVGLPVFMPYSRWFMGIIALLYAVALVSGVIVFLPMLAKNLFALRLVKGAWKKWLDIHNLLGVFSLPFHVVIALSSVLFAYHGVIHNVQTMMFSAPAAIHNHHSHAEKVEHQPVAQSFPPTLAPEEIVRALQKQTPGFVPDVLNYASTDKAKQTLYVIGHDEHYMMRGPAGGLAELDPDSGKILSTEYMPGLQSAPFSILTTFFALHFGSFGGNAVKFGYLILGLVGAFLFYSGNRLWLISRYRKEQKNGATEPGRGTKFLTRLTYGSIFGCVSGVSVLISTALLTPYFGSYLSLSLLYYAVFCICLGVSFVVSDTMRVRILGMCAVITTLAIPLIYVCKSFVS